jgi:hypothetical protein
MLGWVLAVGLLGGCVERRFVITTDPPGATVLRDGHEIGATPVDGGFLYYGTYEFTLIREGYETQKVLQTIKAPWYQYPVIDFFSENLWPFKIRDVRHFHYTLQPRSLPNANEVIDKGELLRNKGKSIGPSEPPAADCKP